MAFSLLFPNESGCEEPIDIHSTNIIKDFELEYYLNPKKVAWEKYVTKDTAVIRYRESLFDDVLKVPELEEIIKYSIDKLDVISDLRRLKNADSDNEGRLYTIKEIELYIDFIVALYDQFSYIQAKLSSEQFTLLWNRIKEVYESDYFRRLKEGVEELTVSVKSIHSLTIGVNLDASLSPYEAGILSVNTEYFRSGDIVSRFMRMEKKDSMMTLVPLAIMTGGLSETERRTMQHAINSGLNKIVESSFKSWRSMIKHYLNDGNIIFFLGLLPELKFILGSMDLIGRLQKMNLPLCVPEVRSIEEKCFTARKLYNPITALKNAESKRRIVYNDISFDQRGELFILTGPNRGGKSVFLNAVGIIQLLFQLGLPVPAASAALSPVNGIFTHYPQNGGTYDKGRFGEECSRLQEILQRLDEYSMILFDESLSGTGAYEASLIGKEVISGMAIIGARGVFSTHLHDLAEKKEEINSENSLKSNVDNLIVGIEEGERTYKVRRGIPEGKSYARDISGKYGLSVEMILLENEKFREAQKN